MSEKKRLMNDLRVIDLRVELEKRKLDKTGVRAVLLKRLVQFLKDEGKDPETFTFDPLPIEAKTPSKRGRTESAAEADAEDALLGDVRVEDMIVQDDVGDEDDLEDDSSKQTPAPKEKAATESKPEPMVTEVAVESTESVASRKREIKDDAEPAEAKKPRVKAPEETTAVATSTPATATPSETAPVSAPAASIRAKEAGKAEEEVKDLNNTDAEDSINLDIGEDELLNDDAENTAKARKDGSEGGAKATAPAASGADGEAGAPGDAGDKQDAQVKSDSNTTSATADDNKDKDEKDAKPESESGESKDRKEDGKDSSGGSAARNLWVSGLSGDTRAKDLKQLCSKHGKVIGAKVVTNARTPGSRCYGYVTMASAQDAENCIKNLHRTELHGRMISVEKARSESAAAGGGPASSRRSSAPSRRSDRRGSAEHGPPKEGAAKDENGVEGAKEGEEASEAKPKADVEKAEGKERSTSRSREKSKGAAERARRERSRERRRSPREVLSFSKIWKERDVARARERSRQAREEERRRRATEEALRERERRQRQEKHRLAVEREKLRAERERIDREKNELLRLERERHKLEREKLELERLELKRAQLRLEEERRKRFESAPAYRKPNSPPPPPSYDRDGRHKRPLPLPLSSSRGAFEAPPPPRFEVATPAYERAVDKRDRAEYKRDYNPRHLSSSNVKYPANGTSNDDARQPVPPGTRPKEPSRGGYEAREGRGTYRSPPPGKPEPRPWASSRYTDSSAPSKEYERGSSSSTWQGASKAYPSSRHAAPAAPTAQTWTKPGSSSNAGESWQSSSGGGGGGGESRYSSSYEGRSYPSTYQPPPPGAAPYVDRYPAAARSHYTQKY